MNEVEIKMQNKEINSFERPKYNVESLIVSNLKYTVVKKEGKNPFNRKEVSKTILDGINLDIKLGQLNAILGPSGSGKTTLLNFMAMRVQENSKPFGIYQVNGIDAYQNKNYRKSVSYIMQDEILLSHLTVKETLTYAARLKLPKQMSEKEKAIHVDELLKKLNLKHCENTIVGQPGVIKGISGGERKRLSIGMELISNPSILFVDEPTSGLDSVMSYEVIELLKRLTQNEGVTVITTIHQPSSDIFKMFDNVVLLKNGKILSYCGTLELIELFNKYDLKMEKFTNPADHFLTVLFDRDNLYSEKFEHIIEHYHETQGKQVKEKLGENVDDTSEIKTGNSFFKKDNKNKQDQSSVYKNSKPSFFYTYRVLTYRAFLSNFRDPQGYFYVVGTTIMMSLIIGLIFLRIGKNSQRSIQDRQGAILFVLVNLGFTGIQQVISTFGPQRAVFLKEYLGGMYGTVPYFFSVISAELVVQALNPLIFISISYFLIGFVPRVDNFFIFFIVITLICLTMNGGGYFIAAAAKDIATALQLVSIIMLPLILMGGFFINASSIPKYLIWVQYISPFKYGYELLMVQEFSSLTFVCKTSELVNGICPKTTGQQVLANYFSFKIYKALNWSLLIVLMVAFNTVALFTLIWRARTYKRKGTI